MMNQTSLLVDKGAILEIFTTENDCTFFVQAIKQVDIIMRGLDLMPVD